MNCLQVYCIPEMLILYFYVENSLYIFSVFLNHINVMDYNGYDKSQSFLGNVAHFPKNKWIK